MRILLRLILSIYYYEKLAEERRFFDAWWQFLFRVSYMFTGLLIMMLNILVGLQSVLFSDKYYFLIVVVITVVDLLFEKKLREKFEPRIINQLRSFRPIPKWILYTLVAFGLIALVVFFSLLCQ